MEELKRLFYKWYKKIDINQNEERIEKRWSAIQNSLELFESRENITQLLKIYYGLSGDKVFIKKLIDYFISEDPTFEEENKEEIVVLAGSLLAVLLSHKNGIFVAFSILEMSEYYGINSKELHDMAKNIVQSETKEKVYSEEIEEIEEIALERVEEGVSETLSEIVEWEEDVVNVLTKMKKNQDILIETLKYENNKNQEKTGILSWIIGEWSNWYEKSLSDIEIEKGAFVIGAELAELTTSPAGPYSATAFIKKMLNKCKAGNRKELALRDFIEMQDAAISQKILEIYGTGKSTSVLPIIDAIEMASLADESGGWISMYRKKWKIDPEKATFDLFKWAELIYRECMIGVY